MTEYILKSKNVLEGTSPDFYEATVSLHFGKNEEPKASRIKSDDEFLIRVETKNSLNKKQKDSLKPFYEIFEKIEV